MVCVRSKSSNAQDHACLSLIQCDADGDAETGVCIGDDVSPSHREMATEVGMVTPVDEKACFGPSQSTARANMHHQED
jgi:hypothetical protein